MVAESTLRIPWREKIRFHVAQAKLCGETGNFAYFHDSRAQYIAKDIDYRAVLQAQGVSDGDLRPLTDLNVSSTQANDNAVTELEEGIKNIHVDPDLTPAEQKQEWKKRILEKNEAAKKKVTDAIDAAANKAIDIIAAFPENIQDNAAAFYEQGMDIAMEAFDYLVARISELWNWIVDFIKGIWTALENTWNAVTDFVSYCVSRLLPGKGSSRINGAYYSNASSGPPATQSLLSLAYSPEISDHDITTSTNRISTAISGKYREATSRDPRNVNISPKPTSTTSGDGKDKLMFVHCETDGDVNPRQRRELMGQVCRSEERSLATSKGTGALKYNIVDLAAPPRSLVK